MAERRMFAKTIIDSDAFLEMPQSTQLLYFHLSMRADDDGFINKPKTIMRIACCKDDDMRILIGKKFIIPFESGVVVIKHWKIHNYIQNDRYNETKYKQEKSQLSLDENKAYKLENNECIQDGYMTDTQYVDTQVRLELGKDSIGKDKESIPDDKSSSRVSKQKYGEFNHVLLTNNELGKLNEDYGEIETQNAIKYLDEAIEMKGYKYKNHNLVLRKWVFDAVKEKINKKQNKQSNTDFYDDMKEWVNVHDSTRVCDN